MVLSFFSVIQCEGLGKVVNDILIENDNKDIIINNKCDEVKEQNELLK